MDAFWLRVALSFALGGLSVAVFTAVAERQGSRAGGLLLSLPVKVVVALAFIAANEGAHFAAEAARVVPAGIAANVLFIAATALLARRWRPLAAIGAALGLWLAFSLTVLLAAPRTLAVAVALWALTATLALVVLTRIPSLRGNMRARKAPRRHRTLVLRALAAGTLVGVALILARTSGSLVSGLASVFPSAWITTMFILAREHGPDLTGATVRVMIAGSAAPAAFGAVVALTYGAIGALLGTLAALGIAIGVTFVAGALLSRLDARSLEKAARGMGAR